MSDDLNAIRARCDMLQELIQHCEADGATLCAALQEAMDHLQRDQAPDTATVQRWRDALVPFAGSALLAELGAARADAAAMRVAIKDWQQAIYGGNLPRAIERMVALADAEHPGAALLADLEQAKADTTAFRAACLHARRSLDLTHDEERLREHLDQVLAIKHPGADLALKIDQLHAQIAGLNLAATQYSESRDLWYLRGSRAEARYAALCRVAEIVVEQWSEIEEPTPLDTDLSALAVALHDGEAEQLAEVEAARAVVDTARQVLSEHLDPSALYGVLAAYDEVTKASE